MNPNCPLAKILLKRTIVGAALAAKYHPFAAKAAPTCQMENLG